MRRSRASYGLVIFDADNTLFDWTAFFADFLRSTVPAVVEIDPCVSSDSLYKALRHVYRREGHVEYWPAIYEAIDNTFRNERDKRFAYERLRITFDAVVDRNLRPYEGVMDGLARLYSQGLDLAVVSNSPQPVLDHRLEVMSMSRLFRLAAGSSATNGWDDVAERLTAFQSTTSRRVYGPRSSRYLQLPRNAGKEQIYHRMVERLGLTLGDRRIWVVGDSVERDLHPAIGLGIQCIWARYGARVDPTDYAELLRVTPWEVGSELPALPTPPSGVQVADHFHDVVAITTGQFPLPRS